MSFTYVVGDIHGCIDQLNTLLAKIEERAPGGKVVFLGDYIDRGPDSKGVLDRLMTGPTAGWTWICLKGNHEEMMIEAGAHPHEREWWLSNGGDATEASSGGRVPRSYIQWVLSLETMLSDEHRIFAHAGVNTENELDHQKSRDLLWLRYPEDCGGPFWGKHLVHGHTPSDQNPSTVGDRTNIDSGCVFGGALTCAIFDDRIAGAPISFIEVAG